MVKLFLFAIFISLQSLAGDFKSVEVNNLKTLTIPAPALGTICAKKLWVYNKEPSSIFEVDFIKGEANQRMSLDGQRITGLTCFKSKLILATEDKSKQIVLKWIPVNESYLLQFAKSKTLPIQGHLTDLACSESGCYLLADGKLYGSEDLEKWPPIIIPAEIQKSDVDTNSNPFDGWTEKLLISQGLYTKVLEIPNSKDFFLLNPFRVNIVRATNSKFSRWGKWGVWEGSLLSPKGFALMPNQRMVLSDPSLRALLLFDWSGNYLGVLASGGNVIAPHFSNQIVANSEKLIVLDVLGKTIYQMEVPEKKSGTENEAFGVRKNLFRRNEVLDDAFRYKCLLCHDGTITDQTYKFLGSKMTHPIVKPFHEKTQLPLEGDSLVTCSSCHDAHHGTDVLVGDKETNVAKKAPFLRMAVPELCVDCHKSKVPSTGNHPDVEKKGCYQCHQSHGAYPFLLRQSEHDLCAKCHQKQAYQHRPVGDLIETDKGRKVRILENKITCLTCHATHGITKNESLLRPPSELLPFCGSCHGSTKVNDLFEHFHSKLKGKK